MISICLFLLAGPGLGQQPLRVVSAQPGNVFYVGQAVRLRVEGGSGIRVRLVDFDGREVKKASPDSTGSVTLGALPRGYYEATASEGDRQVTVPVVVVPRMRLRPNSPVAVDAAHSWLIPPARFEEGADLLRRAGFAWARERLSWGEVEPKRGVFQWGKYDASADAAHKRGIRVYQIFHTSPAWSRADGNTARYPDDLRDAYSFCKAAAEHYKGRMQAWEVWNEADITPFSMQTSSDYAAFLKACYLGFKAGDPKVLVTQVSLAVASPRFHEGLYENGTQSYFDIFNYHNYDPPQRYPDRARGHFEIMDRFGVPSVPIWLTEAGTHLRAVNGTLTPEEKRQQAEFIPKSYAMSLASGTDRHFFFVFPHYLEGGIEFGALDADLKPYPGYAALATVVDMLGAGEYRGSLNLGEGVEARVFDNGAGETAILWTDGPPRNVMLPIPAREAKLSNCVGAEIRPDSGAQLTLSVSHAPIYVRASHGRLGPVTPDRLSRNPANIRPASSYAGRNIVLRLLPKGIEPNKREEAYLLRAGGLTDVQIEVYNLGKTRVVGQIQLSLPAGWKAEPESLHFEAGAMEKVVQRVVVTVPDSARPGDFTWIRATAVPRRDDRWGAGLPQSSPVALPVLVTAPRGG